MSGLKKHIRNFFPSTGNAQLCEVTRGCGDHYQVNDAFPLQKDCFGLLVAQCLTPFTSMGHLGP